MPEIIQCREKSEKYVSALKLRHEYGSMKEFVRMYRALKAMVLSFALITMMRKSDHESRGPSYITSTIKCPKSWGEQEHTVMGMQGNLHTKSRRNLSE